MPDAILYCQLSRKDTSELIGKQWSENWIKAIDEQTGGKRGKDETFGYSLEKYFGSDLFIGIKIAIGNVF